MSVTFLSTSQLISLLKKDTDHYYKTFTKYDLRARNVKTIDEYIKCFYLHFLSHSENYHKRIREKIERYTGVIDDLFSAFSKPWFNGKKAAKIPWKIAYLHDTDVYEAGLPHTRGKNVIVLTSPRNLFSTLVHEKVHLYQKKYPKDVEKYLSEKGFEKVRKRQEKDRIRANPDIDEWIYKKGNLVYKYVYTSAYPKSIEDVNGLYEHPREEMAEEIEKLIVNKKSA
jgi:hypothetical protein